MTVDLFLIEAHRFVPTEYQAWQDARAYWRACADRVFLCESWDGSEFDRLNGRAIAAKSEADRLEQVARDAFQRAY